MKKKNILIGLGFFIIPFFSCLFYLAIYNPGILSYDSYNQISQIHSMTFTNWHPFFHTFIEMICMKIWDNPMSVGIFQITVLSLMWAEISYYLYKKNSKMLLINIVFSIAIFLVIPLNAIYSITLWKDILFSYALLYLTFLLVRLIVDKEDNYKLLVKIPIVMAIIWKLRYNGKIAMICFLICLIVYFIKDKFKIKKIAYYVSILIFSLLAISSLDMIYNVENTEKDALATKAAHYYVFCNENNFFNKEEKELVNEFVDLKKGKEAYSVTFLDPVYEIINEKKFKSNKKEFILLAIKEAVKHPIKTIDYYIDSSCLAWKVVKKDDWVGSVYYTDINSVNNVENYKAVNLGRKRYNVLNNYVNYFKENLYDIFYGPALAMYITTIIVIILIVCFKYSKKIIFTMIPNYINIFVVSLSIPLQDVRYLYSNILVCYFVVLLLIEVALTYRNNNPKLKNKNK